MAKTAWQLMQTTGGGEAMRARLERSFWQASTPLIASLLLQACAPEGSDPQQTEQQLGKGSMTCRDGRWSPMTGLALAEEVDFASLRTVGVISGHPVLDERDAAGSPCLHVSDPRVCEAEMRRISIMETSPGKSHILIEQGETIRALQTLEDKLKLLGVIDTPDEALLLVEHQGNIQIGCDQGPTGEQTRVSLRAGGYHVVTHNPSPCGRGFAEYTVDVDSDGSLKIAVDQKQVIAATSCGTPGRRPANLLARRLCRERMQPLARYFAQAARFEAASVVAFEQLAEELRALGAPRELCEAARRAAEDEVRHARDAGALAAQFGARAELPRLARKRLRDLNEVAFDNALEGCVSETYSAYLATIQARLVAGPGKLRSSLRAIAQDETRHAALSWQLAGYLEARLDPQVRQRIAAARVRAISRLGARAA